MASKYFYEETIVNDYLGKVKTIKAQTLWELEQKVNEQLSKWNEQELRAREKQKIYDLKVQAEYDNINLQAKLNQYRNLLNHSLSINNKLDWESQKIKIKFKKFTFRNEPLLSESYEELKVPKKSFLEIIFPSKKRIREELEKKANDLHKSKLEKHNLDKEKSYQIFLLSKLLYKKIEIDTNQEIDNWKKDFELGVPEAIEKYASVVLENSSYPEELDKEYEIQYNPNIRTLVVSYKLPAPSSIPKTAEYKFIASRKEIDVKDMKKKDFEEFYESIVYQITLRTIHELFEAIYIPYVESIVFNGWVDYIDESNGLETSSCIISIQTNKEDFQKINLHQVDYKKCIRGLKGLYAGKLIDLAPVQPLLNIDRTDKRFVESKEVLAGLHSNFNLASMDWEDFEHLIRQLFEKMFNENGGEVKVTQASRDGGVDAIAFDPDPIRGGKFVIQAKRYNITVPVSAVRDLYGTMLHEGATKGILVTTSSYGKDAYEFIKDKPLTLIDGQNLLHLFNKYGYENLHIALKK